MQEVPPDYNGHEESILRNERSDDVSGAQAEREGIHTNDTSKKHHAQEYYEDAKDQDGDGGSNNNTSSSTGMNVDGP